MDENTNNTPKTLPTLEEAVRKEPKDRTLKKSHSVNVNGREVLVAYRTVRKRKEVR